MIVVRESEVAGIKVPAPHARTLKHLISPWTTGSEHLWVGESIVDVGSTSNPHRHPNEEVFLVLEGEGLAILDEAEARLAPGTLVLIRPNQTHQLKNLGKGALKVICIASPAFGEADFAAVHQLAKK